MNGETYKRYSIHGGIYDLNYNYVGHYSSDIDEVVLVRKPIIYEYDIGYFSEYTPEPFLGTHDGYINHVTIDGITYLMKHDYSLWLIDMKGPFYYLSKEKRMVYCPYHYRDRLNYQREQKKIKVTDPYLHFRKEEFVEKALDKLNKKQIS